MQVAGWPDLAQPALKAIRTVMALNGMRDGSGLTPISITTSSQRIQTSVPTVRIRPGSVTMGAGGDSYYEYLLKQYLISGKADLDFLQQYMAAMNGAREWLLGTTAPGGGVWHSGDGGIAYVGELHSSSIGVKRDEKCAAQAVPSSQGCGLSPKVEHLVRTVHHIPWHACLQLDTAIHMHLHMHVVRLEGSCWRIVSNEKSICCR